MPTPSRSMRPNHKMQLGLQLLLQLVPENSIGIEIGSYAGESAAIFAESGKFHTLFCVDPWDPAYYSGQQLIDAEKKFDAVAEKYRCIVKCKMTADEFFLHPPSINGQSTNFIYIDGNHKYEFVRKDIINSLKLFTTHHSPLTKILSGHDYDYKKSPGVKPAITELLQYPDVVFCDYSWAKIITPELLTANS
jgi:hypothetical protein